MVITVLKRGLFFIYTPVEGVRRRTSDDVFGIKDKNKGAEGQEFIKCTVRQNESLFLLFSIALQRAEFSGQITGDMALLVGLIYTLYEGWGPLVFLSVWSYSHRFIFIIF